GGRRRRPPPLLHARRPDGARAAPHARVRLLLGGGALRRLGLPRAGGLVREALGAARDLLHRRRAVRAARARPAGPPAVRVDRRRKRDIACARTALLPRSVAASAGCDRSRRALPRS